MLTPGIVINLTLDTVFTIFLTIAFFISVEVVFRWDFTKSEQKQFLLQKRLYLVSTITKYILSVKILLFLYFAFTLDHLSSVINGAMCAVGVVEASSYGIYLMVVKLLNLYIFGFWIVLNNADYKHPYLPYAKLKSLFFLLLYFCFVSETVLEYLYFFDIDPQSLVSCCSSVFSATSQSRVATYLSLPTYAMYGSFYAVFFFLVFAFFFNFSRIYAVLNALFIPAALLSLIGYFGTYIYELPTHHCPFCMLQSDYGYIGYLLYITLFLGTFFGILAGFFDKADKWMKKISLSFIFLYVILVSYFPVSYFITHGKWLY